MIKNKVWALFGITNNLVDHKKRRFRSLLAFARDFGICYSGLETPGRVSMTTPIAHSVHRCSQWHCSWRGWETPGRWGAASAAEGSICDLPKNPKHMEASEGFSIGEYQKKYHYPQIKKWFLRLEDLVFLSSRFQQPCPETHETRVWHLWGFHPREDPQGIPPKAPPTSASRFCFLQKRSFLGFNGENGDIWRYCKC